MREEEKESLNKRLNKIFDDCLIRNAIDAVESEFGCYTTDIQEDAIEEIIVLISQALQAQRAEQEYDIRKNIGWLRQYINEHNEPITNETIEHFLGLGKEKSEISKAVGKMKADKIRAELLEKIEKYQANAREHAPNDCDTFIGCRDCAKAEACSDLIAEISGLSEVKKIISQDDK